jgi:hypothetical protein
MKKIIFSILFSITMLVVNGQGNLQFNQVIIVSSVNQTVPAGKVWKLESYQQQQVSITTSFPSTLCSDLDRQRPYYIDNIYYYNLDLGGYGGSNYPNYAKNNFPIWLKAAQTVRTSCSGDFISVIEFNIIP